MEWLKLYVEIACDPKVTSMPEAYRWRLVALMCAHKLEMMPGLSEDELAEWLRISPSELRKTKSLFTAKHFIDANWVLVNWEKRQAGLSESRERMRRYRDKHRDGEEAQPLRNSDVTVTQALRNGDSPAHALARVEKSRVEKSKEEPPNPLGGKPALPAFVLPDWIPQQDWDDYLAMRQRIRKPATERAKQLAVTELAKLRGRGNSPAAVLQQSILRDYVGLFPVDQPKGFASKPAEKPAPRYPLLGMPETPEELAARKASEARTALKLAAALEEARLRKEGKL